MKTETYARHEFCTHAYCVSLSAWLDGCGYYPPKPRPFNSTKAIIMHAAAPAKT